MPSPFGGGASAYPPGVLLSSKNYIGTSLPPLSSRSPSPTKSRNRPFGSPGGGQTWGMMSAASRFGRASTPSHSTIKSGTASSTPFKSHMLKHIDGELAGSPPMVGVTTMHYSRNQQIYLDDFKEASAFKVMHPYVHTTVCGNQIDSSPHNLITGTNFAPTSTNSLWQSETTRQFSSKSPTWARPGETSGGMRTEQLIFDAKYVN